MKKLLAISITLALVASAAFAQVTVGGSVVGNWSILDGSSKDDADDPTTSLGPLGNLIRPRISVTAANEENTFGGWAQLRPLTATEVLTNVWWQPISQVKFTLGYIWGGYNPLVGVATANDDILPIRFHGRSLYGWQNRSFHPWGWEVVQGATVELFPIENLYIIATVPVSDEHKGSAAETFAETSARVGYNIAGIGQVALTFDGGLGRVSAKPLVVQDDIDAAALTANPFDNFGVSADVSYLALGFSLTAVENLGAYIGFELPLAAKTAWAGTPTDADVSWQEPLQVNLRASYAAGAFNVAGGVALQFAGKYSVKNGGTEESYEPGFGVGVTLNPSFDAGIATIGLIGELKTVGDPKVNGDTVDKSGELTFNIIPYVQKKIGSGSAYLGVQIETLHNFQDNTDPVHFSIPVGLEFSF